MKIITQIIIVLTLTACTHNRVVKQSMPVGYTFEAKVTEFQQSVSKDLRLKYYKFYTKAIKPKVVYFSHAYTSTYAKDNCSSLINMSQEEFLTTIHIPLNTAYIRLMDEGRYIGSVSQTFATDNPSVYSFYDKELLQNELYIKNEGDLAFQINNCSNNQVLDFFFIYTYKKEYQLKIFRYYKGEYVEVDFKTFESAL